MEHFILNRIEKLYSQIHVSMGRVLINVIVKDKPPKKTAKSKAKSPRILIWCQPKKTRPTGVHVCV